MKVKELLCGFVRGDFSSIVVFEDDIKVEDFSCAPTSRCLEKYGNRTVFHWFYDFESNEININMDGDRYKILNKEIKEISDIISDNIDFCDVGGGSVSIDEDEVAKAIYDAGYHKIIWHKVADGDLPVMTDAYLCETKRCGLEVLFYNIKSGFFSSGCPVDKNEVIAWMEIPEYNEE